LPRTEQDSRLEREGYAVEYVEGPPTTQVTAEDRRWWEDERRDYDIKRALLKVEELAQVIASMEEGFASMEEKVAAIERRLSEKKPSGRRFKPGREVYDPEYRKPWSSRTTVTHWNGAEGFNQDPQERDPEVLPLIEDAALEAQKELEAQGVEKTLGYCHLLWAVQQRILKERFDIDWKTPAEMNPDVCFD
jgi:hypothetical protein